MKPTNSVSALSVVAAAFVMLFALAIPAYGQALPDDWTHHHVVFSYPGSFAEAMKNGSFDSWYKVASDPRFILQQKKRIVAARPKGDLNFSVTTSRKTKRIRGDWSQWLGSFGTVGQGRYPAKFSFDTNSSPSCSDFVVFNTNRPGSGGPGGQATIIAFDNIYVTANGGTCGSAPTVNWAYMTGLNGTARTSVVLSIDGTQVAFVQSTNNVASLVVLKPKMNDGGTVDFPKIPTSVTAANYHSCSAPCMTTLTFSGSNEDALSSPFYDYANDVLYVGDNNGVLHKFTNIFNSGTPAEITGGGSSSGWPQTVSGTQGFTGLVYDSVSGNVIVGSCGGFLTRIPSSGGSANIVTSAALSPSCSTGTGGIFDAPLVDSSAQKLYAFVGNDGANGNHCNNGNPCFVAVYQLSTSFTANSAGAKKTLGAGGFSVTAYAGAFDNIYFSSGNAASPTGSLYVVGGTSGTTDTTPTLYQVPITNNVLGTPVIGPALATSGLQGASPVSEFFSSPTDRIFLSVQSGNKTTGPINCPSGNGCIMSFNVTTPAGFNTLKTTSATALEPGGTSGIIVDNTGTWAGGAQVYFSRPLSNANNTCGTGTNDGCAVQASQSGLN